MRSLPFLLVATLGLAASGCAANPMFPPKPPASFCDYPVTGALDSISVADLEAVAMAAKPHKIYGIGITGHNDVSIQITPRRHGSETHLEYRRVHGRWLITSQLVVIDWSQVLIGNKAASLSPR